MGKHKTEAEAFRERVFEYLDRLPACRKKISDICKPENIETFKQTVKDYIDERGDGYNGFVVEFSNDYSEIKKWDTVL